MKKLPKYLFQTLYSIMNGCGDDIYFVLGHLDQSTARSYVSKLKKKGLAYTYVNSGTTEVWITDKGVKFLKEYE